MENISYIYIYQFNNQHPEWDTIQTQSVMKINKYAKTFIEYQISTQLLKGASVFNATKTFFECDGDEYMFIKTFRRRNGYTLPVIRTYKIVFDKIQPTFEFELIK